MSTRWIPTLPLNHDHGFRYAVSFDADDPWIVDMNRVSGSGSQWSGSVLRAGIDYASHRPIATEGPHTLKIRMVDPGVVLDRLVIAADAPHTYGGPPETAVAAKDPLTAASGPAP